MAIANRTNRLISCLLLILLAAQTFATAHIHLDEGPVTHQCELCVAAANLVASSQHTEVYVPACFPVAYAVTEKPQATQSLTLYSFQQRAPPSDLL